MLINYKILSLASSIRRALDFFRRTCSLYLIAALASAAQSNYNNHLTCAVYHRMLIGALNSKGLDELTVSEREKMQDQIELANRAGVSESAAFNQSQFNEDWAEKFSLMTAQINSNYQNLYRLKNRYQNSCKELQINQ